MAATRTVFIDTALSNYASLAEQYDTDLFNVVLLDGASPASAQIQAWLNSHPDSAGDINVVSAGNSVTGLFTPRIVFIDASVADLGTVIAGVPADATVVVLDASRDGVQQIHDYLAANQGQVGAIDIVTGLASIDVVSHGSPGELMLGSTVLNAANLADYGSQLAAIGSHLTAGADLLLYGCDVASGTAGQQFISALAAATGADVAASSDLTGSAAAGGDWVLEANTGTIETAALDISGYEGLLDAATSVLAVQLSSDTGSSSSDFVTRTATQTITGSFTASTNGSSTPAIYVSTDGGATRTQASVSYTDNAGNGTFSVTVNLLAGDNRSIQFFTGQNGNNQIPNSAKAYTLDTTAPATTVSTIALSNDSGASSSDFVTNAASQTISGTLSANTAAGEVVRVSLDNGATWQTASNTAGQNTFSLSGVTLNGSGTLKIQVEDAAGNAGPARSQAYVLDTVAPTASALALRDLSDSGIAGDGITSDRSFLLDLSANDPAASMSFEVSRNGGAFSSISSSQTNLVDGNYQFRARVTDLAGNSTTTNTVSITIDATAPNAPSITGFTDNSGSALDTLTKDTTPTIMISAEADVTVDVFRDGVLIGTATQTAPHSGVYSFTSSALADGSYEFAARATDAAGNASPASAAQTIGIDTTLTAPTVVLASDGGAAGDGLTNDASLNFNDVDGDAKRVIEVDGQVVDAYDPASLGDGNHTVKVTDTDGAGNKKSTSLSFTLDTALTAPTVALASDGGAAGDGLTNDASLNFNDVDGDAKRVIEVDGQVVDAYDPASLGDGNHTVKVTDTDGAGNKKSTSLSFVLDTTLTAPTVALASDGGTAGDGLTNDASLSFNDADGDAKRVIEVDGQVVDAYDAASLGDGSHTVKVTDTDGAGNKKSTSLSFVLDTTLTAPTVALASDGGTAGDGLTNDASLSFNDADGDAKRVIEVDGQVVDTYDAASLGDGSHTVKVTDTDGAGNKKSTSLSFTLDTALTAPTVALASDGGAAGDGLTNDASLNFNDADGDAKRVIEVDGQVVDAYDPASLGDGNHTVKVTDTDGAGNKKSTSLSFTLDTALTAPTVALASDGGAAGDGLTNDASLNFNDVDGDAKRVIEVDGQVVDAYDPASLGDGNHTVKVTDTDGAGNKKSTSLSFVLDTTLTAPTVALASDGGTAGDGLTNDASLSFNDADGDAKRVIEVDGQVVDTYDAASLDDGSHTVKVTDTDGAGNKKSTSLSFVLDTTLTAPTVALASDGGTAGDGLTNDASLSFNDADGDAKRVIEVDGQVVDTYDAASLDDGSHTVKVTDTDGAGNKKSTSLSFVLDTTLTAPTVALASDGGTAGDGLTNDASLSFNDADGDAKRVIEVDGQVVDAYDPASLGDGNHTVKVTDTDGAGNKKSTSLSFTLDTTLTAPSVALASDGGAAGDGLTNDARLNFNDADGDAKRVIEVDGQVVDAYDPASLGDGNHTVKVTDTDGAGNKKSTSLSFTLDTTLTAPTVALASDGGTEGDGLTNDASLSFNDADGDAKRVIEVDGKAVDSYDASSLDDGSHTVKVTDTDAAGNKKSTSLSFVLDTTLASPTVALANDSGTKGDGLTNDASLVFNHADGDAQRVIEIDGQAVAGFDAASLADGSHTVKVTDTDAAGNVRTATSAFTLDREGPVFASGTGASIAENAGANQTVYRAQATDAHAIAFALGGKDAARFDISASGVVTLKDNPNFEAVNAYQFTVLATDAAGNRSDQAVNLEVANVNEGPLACPVTMSTLENTQIGFLLADHISDPDAGDKLAFALKADAVTLSWANTDPNASTKLINPVTRAVVELSSLQVKASISPDGTTILLTPPAELDWMVTGQAVKATFTYTVTDTGGLTSSDSITLTMTGSTSDKGLTLSGGNGNDALAGNMTNNAEDLLQGGNGNDTLTGYGGTDALYGGNGDDKLSGGSGIDYLFGDSGNDTLEGGSEGDFLFGGKGNDLLTGGAGADKFVFESQGGSDRIADFKVTEGDKLFFADFFSTTMTAQAFISQYVTDTGNDLVINLQGTSIVLVGVASAEMLGNAISFATPI